MKPEELAKILNAVKAGTMTATEAAQAIDRAYRAAAPKHTHPAEGGYCHY